MKKTKCCYLDLAGTLHVPGSFQRGCDVSSQRGARDAFGAQGKSHRLVRARHARRWGITSTLLRRGRRSYLQVGLVLQ